MLAHFIKLGTRRVCFSLGSRGEALSTGDILMDARRVFLGVSILTVL